VKRNGGGRGATQNRNTHTVQQPALLQKRSGLEHCAGVFLSNEGGVPRGGSMQRGGAPRRRTSTGKPQLTRGCVPLWPRLPPPPATYCRPPECTQSANTLSVEKGAVVREQGGGGGSRRGHAATHSAETVGRRGKSRTPRPSPPLLPHALSHLGLQPPARPRPRALEATILRGRGSGQGYKLGAGRVCQHVKRRPSGGECQTGRVQPQPCLHGGPVLKRGGRGRCPSRSGFCSCGAVRGGDHRHQYEHGTLVPKHRSLRRHCGM
jgi:hypothetical protein